MAKTNPDKGSIRGKGLQDEIFQGSNPWKVFVKWIVPIISVNNANSAYSECKQIMLIVSVINANSAYN